MKHCELFSFPRMERNIEKTTVRCGKINKPLVVIVVCTESNKNKNHRDSLRGIPLPARAHWDFYGFEYCARRRRPRHEYRFFFFFLLFRYLFFSFRIDTQAHVTHKPQQWRRSKNQKSNAFCGFELPKIRLYFANQCVR